MIKSHLELKQIERELKQIDKHIYFLRVKEKLSIEDAINRIIETIEESPEQLKLTDKDIVLEYLDQNKTIH